MKLTLHLGAFLCLISTAFLHVGCDKESDVVSIQTGLIDISVTDAPIDNPEITGAFITIAGIKLNGDTNLLVNKVTIDLLAYQNGNTKKLGIYPVPVGSYQHLELILDIQQDAQGGIPGCYISTVDGKKHNLAASPDLLKNITLPNADINITEDVSADLTIDFDLRKLVKADTTNLAVKYQLIDDRDIPMAIRVVNGELTGTIEGVIDLGNHSNDKVLVFAYSSGSFIAASETTTSASNGLYFQNAINSSSIKADGSFTLAFLPRGSYELIFAVYENDQQNQDLSYLGLLDAKSTAGYLLKDVNVEAKNTVAIAVNTNGLLQ
ncbi:MAG: DUF4382 domain-containing protein [Saprospiraceae bacterium]|nr:DUF4382 domain-containing protein [Saprospiraceae bacterium]